ncbi:GAF domain-containing protein [Cohnella phaseoli]|uniref:GAF domain-containing protein n=1 Tax=Cohnella phaseoli TaxID=456490 RepID=A0A3D9IX17_9BACL|nr:GAF domain-containing protein [Cohnella phaseoli]RED66383.1 GAF domain-containing protein [Cohnella phaseoli]
MFAKEIYTGTKEENYGTLTYQLEHLVKDEPNRIANLANASALLNQFLQEINWVGFYLLEGERELVLGPFQGLPACIRIPLGKGVCGAAAQKGETIVVDDVHQYPGHIACDAASNSEIVLPLRDRNGRLIGVLDIDSPRFSRFDEDDVRGLNRFVEALSSYL